MSQKERIRDLIARLRAGSQVPEFDLRQEAADEIEGLLMLVERHELAADLKRDQQAKDLGDAQRILSRLSRRVSG